MVVYDAKYLDNIEWVHAYSNTNRYILKNGEEPYGHYWFKKSEGLTFTEGEPILDDDDSTAEEIVSILTGESE